MIRYPQVVSALFTALPKRRQGGAELRFGPRGSSRHSFAPLFKTSQLYHFSLHPVSRKAFRSALFCNPGFLSETSEAGLPSAGFLGLDLRYWRRGGVLL